MSRSDTDIKDTSRSGSHGLASGNIETPNKAASAEAERALRSSESDERKDGQSVSEPTAGKSRLSGKARKIQHASLESFVEYCFQLRGRRVALKKADATRIAEAPPPNEHLPKRIAELMKGDPLLDVPPQIILAASPHRGLHRVWPPLTTVFLRALACHPATADIASELESARLERCFPEPAFGVLVDRDFSLPQFTFGGPISKPKANKLRHNTIYAASLWAIINGMCDLEQLIRYLHDSDWSRALQGKRSDKDRLVALGQITDPLQAGLLCSAFTDEVTRLQRQAEEAHQRESEAASRVDDLGAEVATLSHQHEAAITRINELNGRIRQLQSDHEASIAHARDDFERLRARAAQRIESETELLCEGLSAIRRDPPRIHVMEDHAERAIQKLKAELQYLRTEDHR